MKPYPVFLTDYGCKPIEFTTNVHLTPKECWKVARTGIYNNDWFNLTDVQLNIPFKHTYVSKGKHTQGGHCEAKVFERNGREFTSHYEQTTVTLRVTEHSFKTTTGILSKDGFDVLLPHNVRMPSEKGHYTDNRIGVVVWAAETAQCNKETGFTNQFVQLFKGDVDVHLKRSASVKDKFNNALITVYNDDKELKSLPVTFGYSIRYETNVCGAKAYQTNG